jgi:AraC-like DNA-binding protein/Flp pilus assembly protein TadD
MRKTPLPADVHHALRLLNEAPEASHAGPVLARACRVSPRTLQKHFEKYLGQSPTEVLRDIRLDRVRRDLLLGHDSVTVGELAARVGFTHLGRFSGWYRDRFGEAPSATLGRTRRKSAQTKEPRLPAITALDRPTIAVLPFRSAGPPGPASLLSDEIAVALSRRRDLMVTSSHRAEYQVHGKVHTREGGDARVVVTLREAASDRLLWADAWTSPGEGTDGFEERVAERVTRKLLATIHHVETDRAWRRDVSDLTVRDLTARAMSLALVNDPVSQYQGLEFASKAAERAPDDPLPAALAARCHVEWWGHTHYSRRTEELEAGRARLLRAASLRARDPTAEAVLASAYVLLGDLDAADIHIERALALDGGCVWAWFSAGKVPMYRGAPDAAMERLRISDDLDSSGMLHVVRTMQFGFTHFEAGRYTEAVHCWERALAENPTVGWLHKHLGPAKALLGRKDEARAHLRGMRDFTPGWEFSVTNQKKVQPTSHAYNDQLANGWESIGIRSIG